MSNPIYRAEQEVIFNGQKLKILCSIKNFSNNSISYRLEDGSLVLESEILVAPLDSPPGKPTNGVSETGVNQSKQIQKKMLSGMTVKELEKYININDLDIDVGDYSKKAELLQAIFDELEIE